MLRDLKSRRRCARRPQYRPQVEPLERRELPSVFTLPDIPLGPFQNEMLPGTIENDRGFLLGGVGSGLWRHPDQEPPNEFWMVTDRGPNGQITGRRTFPVEGFTPWILRVRAEGESLTVLDKVPIVGQSVTRTTGVTGLSNTSRDEVPWDCFAMTQLAFNANGLDTEDIVRTGHGDFWLVDEYSPSIVKVDSTGMVVKRFVPAGVELPGTDYPVEETLPGILEKRRRNRGFEGLALTPNQKTLYAVLQSPLLNPDSATGTRSRNTRVLAFDVRSGRPIAEYVYRFQPSTEFGTEDPSEMKLSAVVALNQHRLLILERTDQVAKIYWVDLRRATNILGGIWDDPASRPTLEALADPADAGIAVLPKELVIDLRTVPDVPNKIEGLAVIDEQTIAIANDNDFDIGTFDEECDNQGEGVRSQVLLIRPGSLTGAAGGAETQVDPVALVAVPSTGWPSRLPVPALLAATTEVVALPRGVASLHEAFAADRQSTKEPSLNVLRPKEDALALDFEDDRLAQHNLWEWGLTG